MSSNFVSQQMIEELKNLWKQNLYIDCFQKMQKTLYDAKKIISAHDNNLAENEKKIEILFQIMFLLETDLEQDIYEYCFRKMQIALNDAKKIIGAHDNNLAENEKKMEILFQIMFLLGKIPEVIKFTDQEKMTFLFEMEVEDQIKANFTT